VRETLATLFSRRSPAIESESHLDKSHFRDGKFRNENPKSDNAFSHSFYALRRMFIHPRVAVRPSRDIPVQDITPQQLASGEQDLAFKLGHSSLLLRLDGGLWLTDPVLSQRASPVQWAGPKRFHKPPISAQDLPPLKGVVISHNHYDHLDRETIIAIHHKVERFFVPLGVGVSLRRWGVLPRKIVEMDWWESVAFESITVTATPMQHFSGRGLFDGDQTLWASFVLESSEQKLFFSGDGGYFDGFREIGERLGPFDMTFMETGAYDISWPDVHMRPEESMQAHIDLQGKVMVPVHNSTFNLALHPWYEPLSMIRRLAYEREQQVVTPEIGEPVPIGEYKPSKHWWREVEGLRVADVPLPAAIQISR
jgi:L-ascorbate metabolism protein UlaG (beta-lactamase superfamily)